jgi:hypothetical protein
MDQSRCIIGARDFTMITRRLILRGLIAAPSVVAFSSLMPIRGIVMPIQGTMTIAEMQRMYARLQAYEKAIRENKLWIFDQ